VWRSALIHFSESSFPEISFHTYTEFSLETAVQWNLGDFVGRETQQHLLTNKYVEALRVLAPNTGAYVNEADANEPDFQQAFWEATTRACWTSNAGLIPKMCSGVPLVWAISVGKRWEICCAEFNNLKGGFRSVLMTFDSYLFNSNMSLIIFV
jgi:hypothetical protein